MAEMHLFEVRTTAAAKATETKLYLGPLLRFYVYALHGCAAEVMYTALWELVMNYDLKCPGNSHIWAFLIYGTSAMVIEKVHVYLRDKRRFPLLLRGVLYTIWTFFWEFMTGLILRQFNACAWDYEPWFNYHVMGLITLEYTPLWFGVSLVAEQVLVYYTLRLCIEDVKIGNNKKRE